MDRTPVNGLVVSGLAQIALGALAGFPYAIATYKPGQLSTLRVRAPHRIRQLHLDLIIMGGLVTATGAAMPRIPRVVAVPLAVGCWTNALAFAPPAITPSIEGSPAFRALVTVSFLTTATSWVAVAAIALCRWRVARSHGKRVGVEDAIELGRQLDDRPADPAPGLARYDRLRRPRTQAIARRSAISGRLAQVSSPAAARLRDRAARLLSPAVLVRALGPMLDWR